jgi:hypothetical protein
MSRRNRLMSPPNPYQRGNWMPPWIAQPLPSDVRLHQRRNPLAQDLTRRSGLVWPSGGSQPFYTLAGFRAPRGT